MLGPGSQSATVYGPGFMAEIFISHSSKTPFAAMVRDGVVRKLKEKGFNVLLDLERIEPGESWRSTLLRWLGECHGAVILFSREALECSAWVWVEATVLTWRRSRSPGLLLVPALLGDVSLVDEQFDMFDPVQLREIQFASAASDAETTAAVEELVEAIVARFDPTAFTELDGDPQLTRWLERLKSHLFAVRNEFFLREAARALGIDVDRDYRGDDRAGSCGLIAHRLLHADLESALNVLSELANDIKDPDVLKALVDLVKPNWVREEAARHIAPVTRRANPAERNVVINAVQNTSAEHYVKRAYCGSNRVRFVNVSGAGGSTDEVVARYDRAFIHECRLGAMKMDDQAKVRLGLERLNGAGVREKEAWFLVFDRDAIELGVPDRLRNRYQGLTFLLLTGEEWDVANPPNLAKLLRVVPELRQGEEDAAYATIGAMVNLCDT
jgi:hypothetical protein